MCFSPEASFTAAALTGTLGILAVRHTRTPRELPLAAMPLIFSAHQFIEGLMWLGLRGAADPGAVGFGAALYLFIAEVWWPTYVPLAVLLIEPDHRRRQLMRLCLAIGVLSSLFLLWAMLTGHPRADIAGHHVAYNTDHAYFPAMPWLYAAAIVPPLLASSRRAVLAVGCVVLVGGAISWLAFVDAFFSVWCFFAAIASAIIYVHFSGRDRAGRLGAGSAPT